MWCDAPESRIQMDDDILDKLGKDKPFKVEANIACDRVTINFESILQDLLVKWHQKWMCVSSTRNNNIGWQRFKASLVWLIMRRTPWRLLMWLQQFWTLCFPIIIPLIVIVFIMTNFSLRLTFVKLNNKNWWRGREFLCQNQSWT